MLCDLTNHFCFVEKEDLSFIYKVRYRYAIIIEVLEKITYYNNKSGWMLHIIILVQQHSECVVFHIFVFSVCENIKTTLDFNETL